MIDSIKLRNLGKTVLNELKSMRFSSDCELIFRIDKNNLLKLDEDLYYRNFPDGKDYVPTEGEIILQFDNLKIIVMDEKESKISTDNLKE